jgi:cytochrome c oxidase accessory protein FixG
MCKYMCPYARFQSALIDRDSLVIAYDTGRGEARGSRSRKADPRALGLGDCIDCTLCVQVCPTGIDIRNGLQNECIGCAACIDVCDDVMAKMNYPKGLIRYATSQGMDKHWTRAQMLRRAIRPRVLIYGALLLGVSAAFVASVWQRGTVGVDVIRDRGTLARTVEDGQVENVYRLQLMNRSEQPLQVQIGAAGLPGLSVATAAAATIAPNAIDSLTVRLVLPADQAAALKPGAHAITFTVTPQGGSDGQGRSVAEGSTFVVLR